MTTLLRRKPNTGPAKSPTCYCSISPSLQQAASNALNAFIWFVDEMESKGWRDQCHVEFKTRAIAEKHAKLLRDLQLQRQEGVSRPDDDVAYKDLLVEGSRSLRCSLTELLGYFADIHTVASSIAAAEAGVSIPFEKRIRKLAMALMRLFDENVAIDAVSGYEADEHPSEVQAWGFEVVKRHETVMQFLKLFVSRCSTIAPPIMKDEGSPHVVRILDLSTIHVDGAPLALNSARKAALFSLAVLGVENVAIEEFAELYDDDLHRNPGKAVNQAKIAQQALTGLRKSLPNLIVEKPKSKRRRIRGVTLTTDVPTADLKEWLHGRTAQ